MLNRGDLYNLVLRHPHDNHNAQALSSIAISEPEHFHYTIYILKQPQTLVGHPIGNYGVTHLHLINKTMTQQEAKIFLYLAVAHIGAIHNLRFASAIFAYLEHISHYLDVRPAPIHCHHLTPITTGCLILIPRSISAISEVFHPKIPVVA